VRRWLVRSGIVVGALVLAVVVYAVGTFLFRENPGAKSVDEALSDFRQSNAAVDINVQQPKAGVYAAVGAGSASLSFPPATQKYGTEVPVTITPTSPNCWLTKVDFNTAYSQQWTYCIENGRLTEHGNTTSTRWDLGAFTTTNVATFSCEPPGEIVRSEFVVGEKATYRCLGTSTEISGETTSDVTFEALGRESLMVGDESVEAFHFREIDVLTGPQTGTTQIDYWYDTKDLLLLKLVRTVSLRTDSPVGDITYKENGEVALITRVPRS